MKNAEINFFMHCSAIVKGPKDHESEMNSNSHKSEDLQLAYLIRITGAKEVSPEEWTMCRCRS